MQRKGQILQASPVKSGWCKEGSCRLVIPRNRALSRIGVATARGQNLSYINSWTKRVLSFGSLALLGLLLQGVCSPAFTTWLATMWTTHTMNWWTKISLMLCWTQLHYGMVTLDTGFSFSFAETPAVPFPGLILGKWDFTN